MNGAATLISVTVGLPKDLPWAGRTVHTGIVKSPVAGPVMVRRLNLDGDGQAHEHIFYSPRPGGCPRTSWPGWACPLARSSTSAVRPGSCCDIPTRWSCRTGVCHTRVTPLLSGAITYTPQPLEPPAAGQVLICCARPRTAIVRDM